MECSDWTAHRELVRRVCFIEPLAGWYLEHEATLLPTFCPTGCLETTFQWGESPQGIGYWHWINQRLEVNLYEPCLH